MISEIIVETKMTITEGIERSLSTSEYLVARSKTEL